MNCDCKDALPCRYVISVFLKLAVIDAIVQEKKDEEKNRKKYDKMW